jgi:hypothetical protein
MKFNRIYNRFIRSAKKIQLAAPNLSLTEAVGQLLDKGIVYSQPIGSAGISLSGVSAMPTPNILGVSQEIQNALATSNVITITHVIASVETYNTYAAGTESTGNTSVYSTDPEVTSLGNDIFLATIDAIKKVFDEPSNISLGEKGIVELNNFNLNQVKTILPNLVKEGLFTQTNYDTLLDKGIVLSLTISKSEDSEAGYLNYVGTVNISSIETYLKWYEAVG